MLGDVDDVGSRFRLAQAVRVDQFVELECKRRLRLLTDRQPDGLADAAQHLCRFGLLQVVLLDSCRQPCHQLLAVPGSWPVFLLSSEDSPLNPPGKLRRDQ